MAKESFNRYHEWLQLRADLTDPNFYQLCGLEPFEKDLDKIHVAIDRAVVKVRGFRPGSHAAEWARLLDELAAAKEVLTDPEKKVAYDQRLRRPKPATPSTSAEPEHADVAPEIAAVNRDPNLYPPGMAPPSPAPHGSATDKATPADPKPRAAAKQQKQSKQHSTKTSPANAESARPGRKPEPEPRPAAARQAKTNQRRPAAPSGGRPGKKQAGTAPARSRTKPTPPPAPDGGIPAPHPINAHVAPPPESRPSSWPIIVAVAAVICLLTVGMLYLAIYSAG